MWYVWTTDTACRGTTEAGAGPDDALAIVIIIIIIVIIAFLKMRETFVCVWF